jgi:hypothetical protein
MLAGPAIALLVAMQTAAPARADDFLQRITINFSPVYLFSTGDDDIGPPFPGQKALGYTKDNPTVGGVRFDYGAALKINAKTSISFSHSNVGYQLGRILTAAPNTSLVTGSIYDYTDTIALNYTVGNGLGVHGTYFDHQRSVVTGLCLNQKYCYDPTTGTEQSNPLSIDEHGYTVGFTYDFGPTTKIGKLLTAAADAKYVPRPDTPAPGVALGGLGSYVGSQTLFPYSLTLKLPITDSTTFVPFINYTNLPVLYRDSAVPEAYRGIIFGFSKVISKNLTLSYTNLNLQSCRCIARVPPPDNLRLAAGILSLNIHTGL